LIKRDFKLIRVFEPRTTIYDKYSVLKTLTKNNISGTSPVIQEFETNFASRFNRKYGVAVSNGSVALDIAFKSLNLKENDEVILPSHTIISCLSAVIRTNATPVFCDVDPISWNMTLDNVKAKISQNTKAILMVHTFGLPAQAEEIEEYCNENKIFLIEDSAEAHGQSYKDQLCGSFGDISTFSFYANKHITTGEGGIVLTDSKQYYETLLQLRNLDFRSSERFKHENLFWNYRMGGLQASLGLSQIKSLERTIKLKRKQGNFYQSLLENYKDTIQTQPDFYYQKPNHYWVFGIVLKTDNIRDELISLMFNNGIETRPFFWPLHLQNALPKKYRKNESLPNSEKIGKNGLYIPIGPHINKKKQKFIITSLIKNIKSL
tara:strand:+ start:1904 stop:3034 length:1131 start_codon:yes stop_codon:yes gene_type:complete